MNGKQVKPKFVVIDGRRMRRFHALYDALASSADKGGDIYEPLASDAARQVVLIEDQAKVIARLRRDNHKLCGLLQTACEAADVNGRWSVLAPAWFVEAEKLARMLP